MTGDSQTPKPSRVWRAVLVVSLALNLAVVGVVAGFSMRDKTGGSGPRGFDIALGPIGRALDREDRRAIAEELRNDPTLRPGDRDDMRDFVTRFTQLLEADEFDAVAMATLLQSARTRRDDIQMAAQDALMARIAAMTPTERSALATRVSELRDGRGRR